MLQQVSRAARGHRNSQRDDSGWACCHIAACECRYHAGRHIVHSESGLRCGGHPQCSGDANDGRNIRCGGLTKLSGLGRYQDHVGGKQGESMEMEMKDELGVNGRSAGSGRQLA